MARARADKFALLRAQGLTVTDACKKAGFSRDTYWRHKAQLEARTDEIVAEATDTAVLLLKSKTKEVMQLIDQLKNAKVPITNKDGEITGWAPDNRTRMELVRVLANKIHPDAATRHELSGPGGGPINWLGLIALIDAKPTNPSGGS